MSETRTSSESAVPPSAAGLVSTSSASCRLRGASRSGLPELAPRPMRCRPRQRAWTQGCRASRRAPRRRSTACDRPRPSTSHCGRGCRREGVSCGCCRPSSPGLEVRRLVYETPVQPLVQAKSRRHSQHLLRRELVAYVALRDNAWRRTRRILDDGHGVVGLPHARGAHRKRFGPQRFRTGARDTIAICPRPGLQSWAPGSPASR